MRSKHIIQIALIMLIGQQPIQARLINVPDEFESIQSAIEQAAPGDTVLVQPGRYYEHLNFLGQDLLITSLFLFTQDSINIDSTIIDGSQDDGSVVSFRSGETPSARLTGFTIQGGYTDYGAGIYCRNASPTLDHLIVKSNLATSSGGGIYLTRDSEPLIQHCTFTANSAFHGAGISVYLGAYPVIRHCRISDNTECHAGAGIHVADAEVTIECSEITRNIANLPPHNCLGGGIFGSSEAVIDLNSVRISHNQASAGGGLFLQETTLSGNNCQIIENRSGDGGGVYATDRAELTLVGSSICHNISDLIIEGAEEQTFRSGGGIRSQFSTLNLIRCQITDNLALGEGGGIYCHTNQTSLINCTLASNRAASGGAILSNAQSETTLINTIGSFNHPDQLACGTMGVTSGYTISYSDLQGGQDSINLNGNGEIFWREGNFDSDPQFADLDESDYSLLEGSSCIDAGDPETSLDPDSTRADVGALYFHQGERGIAEHGQPRVEPHELQVNAYPNPFNAQLTITVPAPLAKDLELSLYNLAGREVFTSHQTLIANQKWLLLFDASTLSTGLYLLEIREGTVVHRQRVVLLR